MKTISAPVSDSIHQTGAELHDELKILVIHESLPTCISAKRFCNRLRESLDCEFSVSFWDLFILGLPDFNRRVRADARMADLIMVSLGDSCFEPKLLSSRIDSLELHNVDTNTALVFLHACADGDELLQCPAYRVLTSAAASTQRDLYTFDCSARNREADFRPFERAVQSAEERLVERLSQQFA